MIKIGLSARFMHKSPCEGEVGGKAIQYLEQNMANALARSGGLVFLIPSIGSSTELSSEHFMPTEYAKSLDALVLQGGVDICPETYGEKARVSNIQSDGLRDRYELALIDAFSQLGKPVLGICRGMQLINVYRGGTLFQDIPTEIKTSIVHYCAVSRERTEHEIELHVGSTFARLYGAGRKRVNSIHHQSVKNLGRGLAVEATCPEDGIVEAIRSVEGSYLLGVQWHPEFQGSGGQGVLDSTPLFQDFINAAIERREQGGERPRIARRA